MTNFFKNNKWKIFISSLVTVLPILAGIVLWDRLPDMMPTHWGIDGNADAESSKAFAVFGLPIILLAIHLLCCFATSLDKRGREQSNAILSVVMLIVPLMSLCVNGVIYASSLGAVIDVSVFVIIILGVLFVLIGNYLPKVRQNRIIGVRIIWTLKNEDNWYATHRFAGKIWFFGGILAIATAFLPTVIKAVAFFSIVAVLGIAPIVYSWCYSIKHR